MKMVSSKQQRADNTHWWQILALGVPANEAGQPQQIARQSAPVFEVMP